MSIKVFNIHIDNKFANRIVINLNMRFGSVDIFKEIGAKTVRHYGNSSYSIADVTKV